jgi:hypothetical protein
MKSNLAAVDPVPALLDELADGLRLLYECRHRGVTDVDRLLASIEDTMDLIERHRLGNSSELMLLDMNAEDFVTTNWLDDLEFETEDCFKRLAQA